MAKRKQFDLGVAEHPEESGREIERLFDAERNVAQRPTLRDLPIERIHPNPFQARQNFENLDELVLAIQAQGFVSRLRVRPHPELTDHFQLVFGERRLRAAAQGGIRTIPCEIAPHSDAQMIEIGLAENIQRQDLDPLEEAHAFRTLISQRGYTQQRLADRIGKDVSYVTERIHILEDTPPDVQEMVRQRTDTLRAAREIAKLPDAETRAPFIDQVLARSLSTRDVRELVRKQLIQLLETQPVAPTRGMTGLGKDSPWAAQQRDGAPQASGARPPDDGDPPPARRQTSGQAPRASRSPTNDSGTTIDRDIRYVRGIFDRWERQIDTLDDPYLSRLIAFLLDEHLLQVDRLIKVLESNE